MTFRLAGFLLAALLAGCAGWPQPAGGLPTPACAETAGRVPGDARIRLAIDEARRQHQFFGAPTIGRDGGIFRTGFHEAGWGRPVGESVPAWQRVAGFWRALSEADPASLMTSAGRVARAQALPPPAADGSEPDPARVAVHEALLRAAIVDTPWSAAFISHLMRTAGFEAAEFAFSDSHSDYVRAALDASAAEAQGGEPSHAFRACDAATTPPRAGDLLCATRAGTAGTTRFEALAAAMAARPAEQGFPMHCDLVVHAGAGSDDGLETIGGNVLNSVTLSQMAVNGRKVLSDAYLTGAQADRECGAGELPCRGHLSRRPWLVLLQFRR
ncbi:MAG TPA: DUF2272 domain-containing protein [Ramlibacter sp.]